MTVRLVVVFVVFALLGASATGSARGTEDVLGPVDVGGDVSDGGPTEPPVKRPPSYVNPNEPEQFLGATLAGSLLATRPVDWAASDPKFVAAILERLEAGDVGAVQRAGVLLAPKAELTRVNLEAVLAQLPDEVAVPTRNEDGRLFTRSGVDVTASASYLMDEYSIGWLDAVKRLEQQASYNALADWISTELRGSTEFGGAWIDQDDGGRLVLNGTTESFLADRSSDLASNESIRADIVRYSLLELEAAAGDVLADLERAGFVADPVDGLSVGVDVQQNAVVVSIPDDVPDSRLAAIGFGLDDRIVVDRTTAEPAVLQACPRTNCSDAIGAMQIKANNSGNCSANFSFTRGVNKTFYLTAGHCSNAPGWTVTHPRGGFTHRILGKIVWRDFQTGGNLDVSVIDDTNRSLGWPVNEAHIVRSSAVDISDPQIPPIGDQEWAVWTTMGINEVFQNQIICRSGQATADSCGPIVKIVGTYNAEGTVLNQQGRMAGYACSGDSGGPIYDEVSHAAIGILSTGTCDPNNLTITFTYVESALAEYVTANGGSAVVDTVSPSLMRVTTDDGSGDVDPGVGAQILVDGEIRNTWGLSWFEISDGLHEVCFTDMNDFTTPPCQTKLVAPGGTLTVQGLYQRRGILRVITAPAVASTIRVDGIPRNDWGLWVDVEPGSYNVCFGNAVNLLNVTPCQQVSVTSGATSFVTSQPFFPSPGAGEPAPWGMLRVTNSTDSTPSFSVNSQILVDGVIRDRWGLDWLKLAPGFIDLEYTDVQGFTTPPNLTVLISEGATSSRNGVFGERGWLRVYQPTSPVGGTIYVRDLSEPNKGLIARDAWGMWTDYPPGNYQVCWGEVAGMTEPACSTVAVVAGQTTVVTGLYS